MTVAVDICNSALIKLGAERINALTDDTKIARLCQEQYPKIVNRVLRSHLWTFAIKRVVLATVDPSFDFLETNAFALPLDCLRVASINSPETIYKIEGRTLLTSLSSVNLSYISSSTPEAYYDGNFTEALACSLASDLCYAITQSSTMKQQLLAECENWIAQARSFNSQEVSPDNIDFSEWTDSRIIGTRESEILSGFKVP